MDEEIYASDINKILNDYFGRLRAKIKILPNSEQQDILNEIRSDIQTELFHKKIDNPQQRIELLYSILERLGKPEEVANEILSKRIISFKGNFIKRFFVFSGQGILRSLVGIIISSLCIILYFLGILNLAMAGLKGFMPDKTGLFISENGFAGYGFKMGSYDIAFLSTTSIRGDEILGYWIIPLGILAGILILAAANYLFLTARRINI